MTTSSTHKKYMPESITDKFNRLNVNYKELIDKVEYKLIPSQLLLKKTTKEYMLQSATLLSKTKADVLYHPYYDKIATITSTDDTLDLSHKYVMFEKDTNKNKTLMIAVTNEFIQSFRETISKLRVFVNKTITTDYFTQLLSGVLEEIMPRYLPPICAKTLRSTSKTIRGMLPQFKQLYCFKTNHPNFIYAFGTALFEYAHSAEKSQQEIQKEHQEEFDKYNDMLKYCYERNDPLIKYTYNDDIDVFSKMIVMLLKLLNSSNMNPNYIVNLGIVYKYMAMALKYRDDSEENTSMIATCEIIHYELYKVFALMYLYLSTKNSHKFAPSQVREVFKTVGIVTMNGVELNGKKYIEPCISRGTMYICYSYLIHCNGSVHTQKEVEDAFTKIKKYATLTESIPSLNEHIIMIPPEIDSMKELRKIDIGKKNFENCIDHIYSHHDTITNYSKDAEKLNLTAGFGV